MIRTPTSFVVGAGASRIFDLPLGSGLLKDAKGLRQDDQLMAIVTIHSGLDIMNLLPVLDDLEHFEGDSIDDFMEKRGTDETTVKVGRAIIAALMGVALRKRATHKPTIDQRDDWLGLIVRQMAAGAHDFEAFLSQNRARFVTFNFDSLIEERLAPLLEGFYRGQVVPSRIAEALPVIHVHGRLPDPPPRLPRPAHFGADEAWVKWLESAAPQVNVVSDEIEPVVLNLARAAVAEAEVLCFLGFSFHEKNVERLGLPGPGTTGKRPIFATAYDERDAARSRFAARVKAPYGNQPVIGASDETCADVLQDYPVFVD